MVGEIPTTDENGMPVVDVHDPRDADVLCGRGGAALRHPGNQTYRRLVHLNKGLYITCLKAEKLKISRSIVTAIREQDGRFLERNVKKGTWYDIGDKKAIEKTSQALREGQPKLRQKIVELGGGAAGAAALLENQFPDGSKYQLPPQISLAQQQREIEQQTMAEMQQRMMSEMNPHKTMQGEQSNQNREYLHDGYTQHMSEMATATPTIFEESANFQDSMSQINGDGQSPGDATEARMHQNFAPAENVEVGINQNFSTFSLMSDYSNFQMGGGQTNPAGIPPPPNYLSTPDSLMSPSSLSPCMSIGLNLTGDRRKHFARMKYSRPPSGRSNTSATAAAAAAGNGSHRQLYSSNKQLYASNRSLDGMPDFYQVESSASLYSNISAIDQNTTGGGGGAGTPSNGYMIQPDAVNNNNNNVFESRRSIMSGMSRISDTSDMNSIFSDLSRKIGNVSTRSIAMSELSIMDDRMDDVDPDSIPLPSHYF